jgi:hypothetical protein
MLLHPAQLPAFEGSASSQNSPAYKPLSPKEALRTFARWIPATATEGAAVVPWGEAHPLEMPISGRLSEQFTFF